MRRLITIAAAAAAAALATFPAAASGATSTKQLGNDCSVTTFGIGRVTTEPNHFAIFGTGGTSCTGGTGNKSLVVELQVQANTGTHVMWLPAKTVARSNYARNPLRLQVYDDFQGGNGTHHFRISVDATDTHNGVTESRYILSPVLTA